MCFAYSLRYLTGLGLIIMGLAAWYFGTRRWLEVNGGMRLTF